jgi:hypothetical protein
VDEHQHVEGGVHDGIEVEEAVVGDTNKSGASTPLAGQQAALLQQEVFHKLFSFCLPGRMGAQVSL